MGRSRVGGLHGWGVTTAEALIGGTGGPVLTMCGTVGAF